jgi:hypothetical protein
MKAAIRRGLETGFVAVMALLVAACSTTGAPRSTDSDEAAATAGYCDQRLANIVGNWGVQDRAVACSNVNTDCVIAVAKRVPGLSPETLNAACRDNVGNCAGRIAEIYGAAWGYESLHTACQGNVSPDCVEVLALTHNTAQTQWEPAQIHSACVAISCNARLSAVVPGWQAADLATACNNANPDCVITVADTERGLNPLQLNQKCRN